MSHREFEKARQRREQARLADIRRIQEAEERAERERMRQSMEAARNSALFDTYSSDEDDSGEDERGAQHQPPTPVRLKIFRSGESRAKVVSVDGRCAFAPVRAAVEGVVGTECGELLELWYKDDDDDQILVENDGDWDEAVRFAREGSSGAGTPTLRMWVNGGEDGGDEVCDHRESDNRHSSSNSVRSPQSPHMRGTSVSFVRSSPSLGGSSSPVGFAPSPVPASPLGVRVPDGVPTQYTMGKKIGEGACGSVFLAQCGDTGVLYAVKQVFVGDEDAMRSVGQEVGLLVHTGSHPNIVRYFGMTQSGSDALIFMEYVSGGSLAELMRRVGVRSGDNGRAGFTEAVAKRYARQMLQGMAFLHSQGVVHRDLKPGNVLVSAETGAVKLADFGSARILALGGKKAHTFTGTPYYMAPEVIREDAGCGSSNLCDIWSFGCCLVELLTGQPPWWGFEPTAVLWKVGSGSDPLEQVRAWEQEQQNAGQAGVSPGAWEVLEACLAADPEQRPSAEELLEGFQWLERQEEEDERPWWTGLAQIDQDRDDLVRLGSVTRITGS